MTTEIPHKAAGDVPSTEKTTEVEDDKQMAKLEGKALKEALRRQVEFYFSRENLANDAYLVSQMNSQMFVPISIVASFSKVKQLTSEVSLIAEAVRDSKVCTLSDDQSAIKPNMKVERNTIILREIPSATSEDDVKAIFAGCPAQPVNIRSDVGDTWFVTMASEEDAVNTMLELGNKKFQGKAVKARLKSENILRSFYPVPSGADNYMTSSMASPSQYYGQTMPWMSPSGYPMQGSPIYGSPGPTQSSGQSHMHGPASGQANAPRPFRGPGGAAPYRNSASSQDARSFAGRRDRRMQTNHAQNSSGSIRPPVGGAATPGTAGQLRKDVRARGSSGQQSPHGPAGSSPRVSQHAPSAATGAVHVSNNPQTQKKSKDKKQNKAAGAASEAKKLENKPILNAANFPPLPSSSTSEDGDSSGPGPANTSGSRGTTYSGLLKEGPEKSRTMGEDKKGARSVAKRKANEIGYPGAFIKYSYDDIVDIVKHMDDKECMIPEEGRSTFDLDVHNIVLNRKPHPDLLRNQRTYSIEQAREALRQGRPIRSDSVGSLDYESMIYGEDVAAEVRQFRQRQQQAQQEYQKPKQQSEDKKSQSAPGEDLKAESGSGESSAQQHSKITGSSNDPLQRSEESGASASGVNASDSAQQSNSTSLQTGSSDHAEARKPMGGYAAALLNGGGGSMTAAALVARPRPQGPPPQNVKAKSEQTNKSSRQSGDKKGASERSVATDDKGRKQWGKGGGAGQGQSQGSPAATMGKGQSGANPSPVNGEPGVVAGQSAQTVETTPVATSAWGGKRLFAEVVRTQADTPPTMAAVAAGSAGADSQNGPSTSNATARAGASSRSDRSRGKDKGGQRERGSSASRDGLRSPGSRPNGWRDAGKKSDNNGASSEVGSGEWRKNLDGRGRGDREKFNRDRGERNSGHSEGTRGERGSNLSSWRRE